MAGRRSTRLGGALEWLRWQLSRRPRPLWIVCVFHVIALGLALVLYALPHHVIPHSEVSIGVVSVRGGSAAQANPTEAPAAGAEEAAPEATEAVEAAEVVEATPEPTPEPTPDPASVGDFSEKFAAMFTSGDVKMEEDSYQSANVCVRVTKEYFTEIPAWIYVADIYISDISCLKTAFGKDTYGRGYIEWISDVARRYGSVVTLNGDYYGTRDTGVVIRNGTLYRDNKTTNDIAILYWDGRFEIFKGGKIDAKAEMANGAYQSWCFGPALMDGNGKPLEKFNCNDNLTKKNPRSAIGYYEPGHYCFLVVDGRNKESRGASMEQLAGLMEYFGCKQGYNLDGGQTSLLAAGPDLINRPSDGGRNSSDYILIVDRVTQ